MSDNTPADWPEALKAAVAAIYFEDSSDYSSALWSVVRALSPDVAEMLELDPGAAYLQAKSIAARPLAAQAAPLTDELLDYLWVTRPSIHGGDLKLQLRDFARRAIEAALAAPGVPPQPTDGVAPSRKPLRISDPEAAADVAALRNELKDPKKAAAFLRQAGILTAEGKLAPEFGGETPAGVKGPEHG